MPKHIIVHSTKGGVGKSTFVLYISMILKDMGKVVSVINLDQQEHVSVNEDDKADFFIYDTAGVYSGACLELLKASIDVDALIIVPIGVGRNDSTEVRFITGNLESIGVLDKTVFVFNKIRSKKSRLMKDRKLGLRTFGLNVAESSVRILDDIADHQQTKKAKDDFVDVIKELGL